MSNPRVSSGQPSTPLEASVEIKPVDQEAEPNASEMEIGPRILTERDRRYIDRYTVRTRRGVDKHTENLPLNVRIRRGIESVNRRLVYKILERTFHNPPITKRIPIEKARGIFIVPIGPAIGDMVVALPLFHAIRRRNPSCRIGTLISERSKGLVYSDPAITHTYHFRNKDDVRHYPEIARARHDGFDVVINMNLNRMSEFGLISNFISPKGFKVASSHARNDLYRIIYNHLLPYDRNSMHLSQLGLEMLGAAVELGTPAKQWESAPRLAIPEHIRGRIQGAISKELSQLDADWYIHFNPQARNPSREWGLDNAFEFARKFSERYERGAIFFTASPVQRPAVEEHIRRLGLSRVCFFPTSYDLLELSLVSEYSRLIVTPDTSAIHFGTLSGKPTLVLWSDPEFLPMEWLPLQVPSINLAPERRGMPVPTIPVETVWQAAQKLLDGAWTQTATTYGLEPEADPLYQASTGSESLSSLIARSAVPRVFTKDGISVPLSSPTIAPHVIL
ncbi:MAG: hypothetical protein Q8922_02465 [Bacteroidota bacterium]|nr:hypothetical protein [Bacteroidota bacterium]MDP4232260.1 hypothetical protein [Bacteroidota bacterium]MDP4242662.1 hypothetical protein [Bacteroidota bacterium]MDP4286776.1 hypothetical protein [Bacteroidota bacterium]